MPSDVNFNTCGFCHHWNQYHKSCTITSDRKPNDTEKCEMYDLDSHMKLEFEEWEKNGKA